MPFVTYDFQCLDCEHEFENSFYRNVGEFDSNGDTVCPKCGSENIKRLISTPNVAAFTLMSPEMRADSLRRRSEKHSAQELAKEPERFGKAGIEKHQQNKKL